jgi:hypothetical protein
MKIAANWEAFCGDLLTRVKDWGSENTLTLVYITAINGIGWVVTVIACRH